MTPTAYSDNDFTKKVYFRLRTIASFDIRYFREVSACWQSTRVRRKSSRVYIILLNSKISPLSNAESGTSPSSF